MLLSIRLIVVFIPYPIALQNIKSSTTDLAASRDQATDSRKTPIADSSLGSVLRETG